MTRKLILGALALSLVVIGCGGSKSTGIHKPASDKVIQAAPDWYLDPPEDPNYIIEQATATSIDMQMAIDKASTSARANIAKALETKLSALSKRFQEEVGTGEDAEYLDMFTNVVKEVTSTVINGAQIAQREIQNEGGVFRAYVMIKMPIGATADALMTRLKKQENLYTRFRATQGFEDLKNEVEEHEKWKAEQGMP